MDKNQAEVVEHLQSIIEAYKAQLMWATRTHGTGSHEAAAVLDKVVAWDEAHRILAQAWGH